MVVFPAPFGPSRPDDLARGDVEVHAAHDRAAAVRLREVERAERGGHYRQLVPPRVWVRVCSLPSTTIVSVRLSNVRRFPVVSAPHSSLMTTGSAAHDVALVGGEIGQPRAPGLAILIAEGDVLVRLRAIELVAGLLQEQLDLRRGHVSLRTIDVRFPDVGGASRRFFVLKILGGRGRGHALLAAVLPLLDERDGRVDRAVSREIAALFVQDDRVRPDRRVALPELRVAAVGGLRRRSVVEQLVGGCGHQLIVLEHRRHASLGFLGRVLLLRLQLALDRAGRFDRRARERDVDSFSVDGNAVVHDLRRA